MTKPDFRADPLTSGRQGPREARRDVLDVLHDPQPLLHCAWHQDR